VFSKRNHSAVVLIADVLEGTPVTGDVGRTEDPEQGRNPVDTGSKW